MWRKTHGRSLNSWPYRNIRLILYLQFMISLFRSLQPQPSVPRRVRTSQVGHLPRSRPNLEGRYARSGRSHNGKVKKSFVSFAARLQSSPLPSARLLGADPPTQGPPNTSASELPKATDGSTEVDPILVDTEAADNT